MRCSDATGKDADDAEEEEGIGGAAALVEEEEDGSLSAVAESDVMGAAAVP